MNDVVKSTNNIIEENLIGLNENLEKIKICLDNEEDKEYEDFYNRISFYFSNIIVQLKLKFIENLEILEKKNKENEKEILNLIMENMLLKIENENYEKNNLLNISNYIEFPLENSKTEVNITNINNQKRSRNNFLLDYNNISFKNESKDNIIQKKIQKKSNLNHYSVSSVNGCNNVNINNNCNNNNNNNGFLKKNNLSNFISYSKLINNKKNINYIQNNNINYLNSNNSNSNKHNIITHYRSYTNDNYCNNNNLIGEKSMYNLPTKLKNSFNELNNISNIKQINRKNYNIHIGISRNKSMQKSIKNFSLNNNYVYNKSTINLNIPTQQNYLNTSTNNKIFEKDFNRYQKNLIQKINSIHKTNMKGIINMKMKNTSHSKINNKK